MSRYTYVRQKQPNQWVAVAVSDLKVQIKAYILDKYLDRVPKPRIFEAIRRDIGYLIKELEDDGKGDSAESYREELCYNVCAARASLKACPAARLGAHGLLIGYCGG